MMGPPKYPPNWFALQIRVAVDAVVRVCVAVAEELEDAAVPLVATGLGDDIDGGAGVDAVLGPTFPWSGR